MAFEEDPFDTIQLIQEVESRPILWDHSVPEYGNRLRKIREWEEIYRMFYGNWEMMKSSDRDAAGRNIQKRWKNLRDNFMKDLKLQKMKTNSMKKKKKYIYFDKLQFLKKAVLYKRSEKWIHHKLEDSQDANDNFDDYQPEEHILLNGHSFQPEPEGLPQYMDCSIAEQQFEDEDRMFLLSLVSDFKQIPQKRKLGVKSEIIQLILRAQCEGVQPYGGNGFYGQYGQYPAAAAVYSRSPSPSPPVLEPQKFAEDVKSETS